MNPPEQRCEVPGCSGKVTVFLNNRPLCGEHAWEETRKVKK
jgi:hypothetical protein